MSVFSTIACCIDLSENNEDIVSYTREMAELTGAKVLLVHVLPSADNFAGYGVSRELLQKVSAESLERAKNHLENFARKYFSDLKCNTLVLEGSVDKALEDLVDRSCAELVIMGSMNSRGLLSLSGSTARLIGHTRVPVMVIPNDLNLECTPEEGF